VANGLRDWLAVSKELDGRAPLTWTAIEDLVSRRRQNAMESSAPNYADSLVLDRVQPRLKRNLVS
jgi:hypothetical protein